MRADVSALGPAAPPEASPTDSLQTHIEKVRRLSARPIGKSAGSSRLEQLDQELATALLQLSVAPTAQNHRVVAERYRRLGVADTAYGHFSRALALDRQDAGAHDGLARIWRDWGLPALALGDAHRAIFYAPQSAAARNTLGTVLQALGQRDQARRAYEEAVRLDPAAVYAISNVCYLSFLGGDFKNAVETCRSAVAMDPSSLAARNNLALAYAAAGDLDLAQAELMKADGKATGLFNTGILHMAARNYATAAIAFDAAARADPLMNIARERADQARRLGNVMDGRRR